MSGRGRPMQAYFLTLLFAASYLDQFLAEKSLSRYLTVLVVILRVGKCFISELSFGLSPLYHSSFPHRYSSISTSWASKSLLERGRIQAGRRQIGISGRDLCFCIRVFSGGKKEVFVFLSIPLSIVLDVVSS